MIDNTSYVVLIVDDDPANLGVMFEILTQTNYQVRLAQDGAVALRQASQVQPDIILLDITMPGMDGFTCCRRLKMNPQTADIPVVFLTASHETIDKVRGFEVGGVDYLTKPIEPAELLARLETHLMLHSLRLELEEKNRLLNQQVNTYAATLESETEKRRFYEQESRNLLESLAQQNETLTEISAQLLSESQNPSEIIGQHLHDGVAKQLDEASHLLEKASKGEENFDPWLKQAQTLLKKARKQLNVVLEQLSSNANDPWQNPLLKLSEREREVLLYTVQGLSSREIGLQMNISNNTARVYRSRIMRKLDVESTTDLIKLAIRYRLVDDPTSPNPSAEA